jgi:hypothetical protein
VVDGGRDGIEEGHALPLSQRCRWRRYQGFDFPNSTAETRSTLLLLNAANMFVDPIAICGPKTPWHPPFILLGSTVAPFRQ